MYMDADKIKESMENLTVLNVTRSLIPKRIPMDSGEWFKTFGTQPGYARNSETIQSYYADGDYMFYLVTSLIILVLVCVILGLYGACCVWVLKGNLDLPTPGGGGQKKYKVWIKNPFTPIRLWFSRYNIQSDDNPTSTDNKPTDNSVNLPGQGKITTISHSPSPSDAGSDEPTPRSSSVFESKTSGLCDSFRQFQQFQYDLQDDEQEEIVFDVFDLKT